MTLNLPLKYILFFSSTGLRYNTCLYSRMVFMYMSNISNDTCLSNITMCMYIYLYILCGLFWVYSVYSSKQQVCLLAGMYGSCWLTSQTCCSHMHWHTLTHTDTYTHSDLRSLSHWDDICCQARWTQRSAQISHRHMYTYFWRKSRCIVYMYPGYGYWLYNLNTPESTSSLCVIIIIAMAMQPSWRFSYFIGWHTGQALTLSVRFVYGEKKSL